MPSERSLNSVVAILLTLGAGCDGAFYFSRSAAERRELPRATLGAIGVRVRGPRCLPPRFSQSPSDRLAYRVRFVMRRGPRESGRRTAKSQGQGVRSMFSADGYVVGVSAHWPKNGPDPD